VTVLADSMAASLMRAGRVDLCIVGADRIAANGDVANKIGTYALALAARYHGVPFYVAAPSSTIDSGVADGDAIVIEQRGAAELLDGLAGPTAPAGVRAYNPAFDVTPASLVSAIVTNRGVIRPPYHFVPEGAGAAPSGLPGQSAPAPGGPPPDGEDAPADADRRDLRAVGRGVPARSERAAAPGAPAVPPRRPGPVVA
jgi:hypothetical protein